MDRSPIVSVETKLLADSITQDLASTLSSASSLSSSIQPLCIYRVPEKLTKMNEHAYVPNIVSIGPFHHENVALQAMENHKLRYVEALLSRLVNRRAILEQCIEAMNILEDEARKCYSEPFYELDKNKFIRMMIIDGLFIIELLRRSSGVIRKYRDDPIFKNVWNIVSLVRDMILLENQLPMFVLERLISITTINQNVGKTLPELAIRFFNQLMPREDIVLTNYFAVEGKHFLDLLVNSFYDLPDKEIYSHFVKSVPCVTELQLVGVRFKMGDSTRSFLDIRFRDGVMEISPLLIQDETYSLLRNFIAYEQCSDGHPTYVTSYAFFMDKFINSSSDVALLRERGIITNYVGDDDSVVSLFNKLCSEAVVRNFYYSDLCDAVNYFYRRRRSGWYEQKATLKRDYLQNMWKSISVIAAVVLLILTLSRPLCLQFFLLRFITHKSYSIN